MFKDDVSIYLQTVLLRELGDRLCLFCGIWLHKVHKLQKQGNVETVLDFYCNVPCRVSCLVFFDKLSGLQL